MALPQIAEQSTQDADVDRKVATRSGRPTARHSKIRSSRDVKGKKREQVDGKEINSGQSRIPSPDAEELSTTSAAPAQPDPIATPTPGASVSTTAPVRARHGVTVKSQDFSAFGIDAYHTRAVDPQICVDFVLPGKQCFHRHHCRRVHPKDKDFYYRKMTGALSLSSSDSGNSSAIAELDERSTANSSTTKSASHSSTRDNSPVRPPASNIRGPGWDPETGHWDFGLDQAAWSTEDSWSSGQSEETSSTISKTVHSRNSSDTEDENRAQSRHTSPIPRFSRELCQNFLRGRCFRGPSCRYYHDQLQVPQTTLEVAKFPITGIGTPRSQASSRADGCQSLPPSKPKVLYPRPPVDEVCRNWLRGDCQRGYRCNFIHKDLEYDESLPPRRLDQAPRFLPPRFQALQLQATGLVEVAQSSPPTDTKVRHPRPPSDDVCRDWLRGDCRKGHHCNYIHKDLDYDESMPRRQPPQAAQPQAPNRVDVSQSSPPKKPNVRHPRPPFDNVCRNSLRGDCRKGHHCNYIHKDLEYDESMPRRQPAQAAQPQAPHRADVSQSSPPTEPKVRHPRPPFDDVCRNWLRGDCLRGYRCYHIHQDLDYDESIPRRPLLQVPARTPPEFFSTTIYKHIKIKVTDGCEVTEVTTGFETSWIYIGNVPWGVKQDELADLLKSHGELIDLRLPEKSTNPLFTAKARFSSPAEASRLCSVLNGLNVFKSTLTAKLTISASCAGSNTHLHDTTVRVSWEAPSKTAYVGFPTKEASLDALTKARFTPLGKHLLKGAVHTGLPAVGRFNIRFDGVPADTDSEAMKAFSGADGIMWGKVNYDSHHRALNGIQRMLKESGAEMLDFDVMPPPYRNGLIVGWAHLASSADAKKLCDYMHGRKPVFTGLTRIFARHIHSLEYSLTLDVYDNFKQDINALAATAWRMGRLSVSCRPHPTYVAVRLGAEDTQGLSKLKGELDIILSGEVVRDNGKVVWHGFFLGISGQNFIASLERQHAPLKITVDRVRKMVRLFGVSVERLAARMKILEKVEELRKQKVHTIPLDSRAFGVFMNDGLQELQKELGEDTVHLDLWNRALTVRGDQHAYDAARDAVVRARRTQFTSQLPTIIQCPVCFDQVSTPITLCCGHSWCKTCLTRYMMTAVDEKFFPLTCLGDDGKCQEKIPLNCAKQLLPAADFEALIEAAFSAHVNRHLDEFCFCPTPDCPQIYRRMPRIEVPKSSPKSQRKSGNTSTTATSSSSAVSVGTNLQCPSCLVKICASCQTEAHDGLLCVRPDEGDSLFDEWMKNNDVKPCPGCKMPIEKAMGCHHVTCTVCSTHLCWVCLMPFHNGAGVYSHMLAIHGSFV